MNFMSEVSKMKWCGRELVSLGLLLGVLLVFEAGTMKSWSSTNVASGADDVVNPYLVIAERNVFRLNPPPPPPEPDKGPPPVLPDVYLSGFMRTGDQWKVYLVTKVENPDPHGAPLNVYLNLAEGEKQKVGSGAKQAELQLVKVYAELEKVDIINSGTPMTLTAQDNGFAKAAAAPNAKKGTTTSRRNPIPSDLPNLPSSAPRVSAEAENPVPRPNPPGPLAGPPLVPGGQPPPPPPNDVEPAPPNGNSTIILGGAEGTPE
jgi:hypothetical protein